ncbi:MAG: uroporphyrinogen decarboxylase family protein [Promethearchaeota archaeon]
MNAEERVIKTINHEEPDKVPYFESAFTNNTIMKHFGVEPGSLTSIPKLPEKMLKKLSGSKRILKSGYKKTYEFARRVGMDIVLSISSLFPRKVLGGGIIVDEFGRMMRNEIYEKDGTIIYGYVGGYFKNFEDFESWEHPDPQWEGRVNGFIAGKEVQKKMNDEIFAVPSTAALMEVSWECFGIETFSRVIAKSKQAKAIFDERGKFALEVVKILGELEAKLILLWDDYGFKNGLFMSPRNYRTYVFPWLKRICEAAHKKDCKILLHSDGDLTEIFEDIIACGVDALNPIEPTTANPEYDIFKLNQKYGDNITFVGNVSPVMLATGEISEIEEYSKRLIRELAPGGGYIFSSGHSINPAVTLDRYLAYIGVKNKYGKYPIHVPD